MWAKSRVKNHASYLMICRLHPLNLVIAAVCSLFVQVAYWRKEYIPKPCLKRFTVLDPTEHFDLDEWRALVERAFRSFKGTVGRDHASYQTDRVIDGQHVDFTNNWLQAIAIQHEEAFLFRGMASRWIERMPNAAAEGRCFVAAGAVDLVATTLIGEHKGPAPGFRYIRLFARIDQFWAWIIALLHATKQIALLMRAKPSQVCDVQIIWAGISQSEIPAADNRLDFSFLAKRRLLDPATCLYVLPNYPTPPQRHYLATNGIRWMNRGDYGVLSFRNRLSAVRAIAKQVLIDTVFPAPRRNAVALDLCVRAIPWLFVVRTLKPRRYVTSATSAWPELPEVAVINALGIRTISWSYGSNTFHYSVSDPHYEDLGLLRSIQAIQEAWEWSNETANWLKARKLLSASVIRIIGPVMCGDTRWLTKTPHEARIAYGISEQTGQRFIAAFDVPTISKSIRLEIGHGPSTYPIEMLEQFFSDVEALLERFPQLVLILKPKRSLQDTRREFAASMGRLLDRDGFFTKQGRVIIVDHDIDPYIPVALADICIGVPFTSPVTTGLAAGRCGIYHDPLRRVNYARPSNLMRHVTHGRDDLLKRIAQALGEDRFQAGRITLDPAETFARLLHDQAAADAATVTSGIDRRNGPGA